MGESVEISICIPAYKNTSFLVRLLDSISVQTFKHFEVIITDDTPDDSVENLLKNYNAFKVKYYRNIEPLGTPENWNESIRKSSGKWIKLMHNDDRFTTPEALQIFYDAAKKNPGCSFFFSAFKNVVEGTNKIEVVKCNRFDRLFLRLSPLHLFKRVYVGNPSCTFIKADIGEWYDKNFKFVVDFEYYIRCFKKLKAYHYIDNVLLDIGFHNEQVTKYTFLVPDVQIPENILLLEKMGYSILRNLFVYDYYWRIFRNLEIRKEEDIKKFYKGRLHPLITDMIQLQRKLPTSILTKGFKSKVFMIISYVRSLFISIN